MLQAFSIQINMRIKYGENLIQQFIILTVVLITYDGFSENARPRCEEWDKLGLGGSGGQFCGSAWDQWWFFSLFYIPIVVQLIQRLMKPRI
jgi:hypothetical protein